LKQRIKIVVSVLLSFVLVAGLVGSYRRQSETEQQLSEVKQALARNSSSAQSIAPQQTNVPSTTPIVLDTQTDGSPTVRKQHNLEEILSAGWKLVDQRSPDQAARAVQIFSEGLANVDPKSPELYNGLGRALLVAGRPREAIKAWSQGLELSPQFSEMQSGIGWAYWRLNDPYRAKEAWQKALSFNPHSIDAWSAVAWIELALGNHSEAKRGFQELVNSDPKHKSWALGLSMARAGNSDVQEIAQFFALPPLDQFERPLSVDRANSTEAVSMQP